MSVKCLIGKNVSRQQTSIIALKLISKCSVRECQLNGKQDQHVRVHVWTCSRNGKVEDRDNEKAPSRYVT